MKFTEWLKQETLLKINQYLERLPFITSIYEGIDQRIDLMNINIGLTRREMTSVKTLYDIIEASFQPVVLFKGKIKLRGTDIKELYDYAFAVKASAKNAMSGKLIINFQPDTTITFTSLELLNGPYDIQEIQIASCHLIPTHIGIIPPGIETKLPAMVGEISPANRVYIVLGKRE